ncbi:hypothetical protein [Microvirga aerophila]|uniref:Uncharacterized protein n=1 Tax=Microvirga aerophila TaxID=670291 RepID=A0A512BUI9_9HYPH|nr:hypothetical protein [Microvirga aerophila]GEO15641.1 hypothetical protein MAE02_33370 [Microvirga aerophila]
MTFAKRSALALGLGLTLIGGAFAASSDRNDGTWSVQMVTDSGLCDRTYGYSIAIENGNVRYLLAPGDSPTTVSGRIGPDGAVDLDIRRSIAKVDATGRLNGKSGSGTWTLGMLGCTGRWTAQKRSNIVQS